MQQANQRWRQTLRILWLGQFLVTAGLTIVVPLLPFYLEELGVVNEAENRFWSSLALAAPAIPLMLAAPLWGRLGDRYGRKLMVVRALLGIAVSVLLMGISRTPMMFVICRLLQGAFGGVDDAAASFISSQAPTEARGRAMGYLQTATAAGALSGPLMGGFLSRYWGFAPLIVMTGGLIASASLLAALTLREAPSEAPTQRTALQLRAAVLKIVRQRTVRGFVIAGLCVQIGSYGLIAAFAVHIRSLLTHADDAGGWVGGLQAITWAATLVGAAWWGRRNDSQRVERTFIIAACGYALSVILQAFPVQAGWFIPLRIAHGFCLSALGQSVYLRASQSAPQGQHGVYIGVANSFLTLGQVLGSFVGAIVAGWVGSNGTFLIMGGIISIGALSVWLLKDTSEPTILAATEQGVVSS